MTQQIKIGVIGGTGLYQMQNLTVEQEIEVDTPFGKPSDNILIGNIDGHQVAFLSRHGRGHLYNPTEVPYRANIHALKSLGVQHIIAVSACGSLREDYAPGNIVIADQLVDFTKGKRDVTFFENGLVAHVGVADPFCNELREVLFDSVQSVGGNVHAEGKFITIEGPRFSTKAESELYRAWGMDIIGMTTSPEAFLAREAEICYAVMAMVTDYDVWHDHEVSAASVTKIFSQNVQTVQKAIVQALPHIASLSTSTPSHNALSGALTTSHDSISDERYETHQLFLDNLLS